MSAAPGRPEPGHGRPNGHPTPSERLAALSARQGRRPKSVPVTHVLHPGDVVCVERGERVQTLLGSCVAVVLTDERRSIAAVCHLVHAGDGAMAFETMDAMLSARGFNPRFCEAFVYGGVDEVLPLKEMASAILAFDRR